MHVVRSCAALLFAVLATACADFPTAPSVPHDTQIVPGASGPSTALETVIVIGICDPELSLDRCGEGGDACMTSTEFPLAADDFASVSGCGTGTGGGGGGAAAPPVPPAPIYEGPGAFALCVGTLLGLMGGTAMMQPLAEGVYNARNEYDSARRMYDAVMSNNPSLEMELLYAQRVDVARSGYNGAMQTYALAAGASAVVVMGAVVACSPGIILPTP